MKRRWDEVQYAYHVPEELRRRIGQTPVFEAGKPLKFSSFTVFLFGMLVGLLAVIMLGLALADGVGKAGWEIRFCVVLPGFCSVGPRGGFWLVGIVKDLSGRRASASIGSMASSARPALSFLK
jgi:hypothetical protein